MLSRQEVIQQFIQRQFNGQLVRREPLHGDASFRRYERLVLAQQQWMFMDAPPPIEDVGRFIAVAEALASAGVRVPSILASDLEHGLLVLEDLGDVVLAERLGQAPEVWYQQALELLPKIQQVKATARGSLPEFDHAFILRELSIFTEWFLQTHLQWQLSASEQNMLDQCFTRLAANLQAQPQVGMHRDFHSRNFMVLSDAQLAVIDFQDMVCGPVCYDAVSLLRDCYVRWPDALVAELRDHYFEQLCLRELYRTDQHAQFVQDFDWTGLQRHIKVLGIFCRLYHRDGKARYLADLPRVFQYVTDIAARYPELAAFHQWLTQQVQPVFQRVCA